MLSKDIETAAEYFGMIAEGESVAVIHPAYMRQITAMMNDWAKRAEALENAPIPLDLQKRQKNAVLGPFEPGGAA